MIDANRPGHASISYSRLLLTVSLGGVLAPLNSTMLAVALPELRRAFGVGHAEIAWLVSAYLIAMAVAQPLGGRLGDQLGRVPVFRVGLVLFLALSLGAAFAPTFPVLIVMRTSQALVGAAVIPNGMAMIRETVSIDRLGRSSGLTGSAVSIAAAVGPLLGAGLLALGSWRLLFLMNVPLVAAALLSLTLLHYPHEHRRFSLRLDWLGAVVFAAVLALITLLLDALRGGQSDVLVGAAIIGLPVFLVAFVYRQFSTPNPVAEWRLFRIRSYAASTGYILLTNLVMYTTILAVPFFVDEVQGKGSLRTGILLGAVSVPVVLVAPIGGRLSDSLGRRPLVVTGAVLVSAGAAALLGGISRDVPWLFLAAILALLGLGLGLSIGPASAAAIETAPRELAGAAAGTNSMMRYIGSIVGVGILGAVLNSDVANPGVGLFRLIFAVLLVMSAGAFVCALFVHRFPGEPLREASPAVPQPMPADASQAQT